MQASSHSLALAHAPRESPRLLACPFVISDGFHLPETLDFTSAEQLTQLFMGASATLIMDCHGKCYTVADVTPSGQDETGNTAFHLALGVDSNNIIDYLPLEALTIANAPNAPRQVVFGFMGGFFSSPKRVVQVVSVQTNSTGSICHVAFDVRKEGSGGVTYDIAYKRMQRTLPVFLREFVAHLPDGVSNPAPKFDAHNLRLPPPKSSNELAKKKLTLFNLSPFRHLKKALTSLGLLKGDPPAISEEDVIVIMKGATEEHSMSRAVAVEAASAANVALKTCKDSSQRVAAVRRAAKGSEVPLEAAAAVINSIMREVTSTRNDESEDTSDDYSSSPSISEASPPPTAKRLYQKPAQPKKRRHVSVSSHDSDGTASSPPPKRRLPSALDRITPARESPLEAARVFFSTVAMRTAARLEEEVPHEVPVEEEPALAFRYGLALQRLIGVIGDTWIEPSPPASMSELRIWREVALDKISTYQSHAAHRDELRTHKKRRPKEESFSSESEEGDDSRARHVANSPEAQVGAVASEVARRLNKKAAEIHFEPHDRVRDGITRAPADIREDLARAIGSNGKVDAPGEKRVARASIPPPVRCMQAALVARVQQQIAKVQLEDESGMMYLAPGAARKLAVAAVSGQLKLSDFNNASRSLLGTAAPERGSIDELREAWALAKVALLSVGGEIYDLDSTDPGILRVEAKMHATAKSLRIDSKDLASWIKRIFESWEQQVHDFRLLQCPPPSFKKCTAMHESFVARIATAAALAEQMEARLESRVLQRLGATPGYHKGGTGKDREGKPKTFPKKTNTPNNVPGEEGLKTDPSKDAKSSKKEKKQGASAWQDMPRMPRPAYNSFRKELQDAFPDVCIFYLAGKCSRRDKCDKPHTIPDGYATIKEKFANSK